MLLFQSLPAEERKNDLELLEAAPPDDAGGSSSRALIPNAKDADDVDADLSSDEPDSDSDDDSDDEAELKAELERIRAERAAEAERKAAEEEKKRQDAIRAEVLSGNPLMQGDVDFGVKRRCAGNSSSSNKSCTYRPHTAAILHINGSTSAAAPVVVYARLRKNVGHVVAAGVATGRQYVLAYPISVQLLCL